MSKKKGQMGDKPLTQERAGKMVGGWKMRRKKRKNGLQKKKVQKETGKRVGEFSQDEREEGEYSPGFRGA